MTTNKNILVTGGAGYIGSHVCKYLAENGYNPIVFDNFSRGNRSACKWGKVVEGDLCSVGNYQLRNAISIHEPIGVIHLAALAYVGESFEKPAEYYENNVIGTFNLLTVMREFGVKHLVFSSSCAVYGVPENGMAISESVDKMPISPYGRSKQMCEAIVEDFTSAFGLTAICLRYFNAAGASLDGDIGELHTPETHIIPLTIRSALGLGKLRVSGNQHPTIDGTCVRDFVHVSDLARAHGMALNALLGGEPSNTFNLGSGQGKSIMDVINTVASVVKHEVDFVIGSPSLGDPPSLIADASKVKRCLGWVPEISFEQIISSAYNWEARDK